MKFKKDGYYGEIGSIGCRGNVRRVLVLPAGGREKQRNDELRDLYSTDMMRVKK